MQSAYIYEQDPGHGWLHVRRAEITRLGIALEITPYSYQRGDLVFLEEDCDLSTFMRAKEAAGEPVTFEDRHVEHTSIRGYDAYRPIA